MLALALLAPIMVPMLAPEPVLWLDPSGVVKVEGKIAKARLAGAAKTVGTPYGAGLDLSGTRGGLFLEDFPALALTGPITVSTWVYLRRYVSSGPGAQILMRGDDRNGNDPYFLSVGPNGNVAWTIDSADPKGGEGSRAAIEMEVPLRQWVRITATFDPEGREMRLWSGDRLMAAGTMDRRPLGPLDPKQHPGVGIGNVQTDLGPHDQPLDGVLVDLRVYAAALSPRDAGFRPNNGS